MAKITTKYYQAANLNETFYFTAKLKKESNG